MMQGIAECVSSPCGTISAKWCSLMYNSPEDLQPFTPEQINRYMRNGENVLDAMRRDERYAIIHDPQRGVLAMISIFDDQFDQAFDPICLGADETVTCVIGWAVAQKVVATEDQEVLLSRTIEQHGRRERLMHLNVVRREKVAGEVHDRMVASIIIPEKDNVYHGHARISIPGKVMRGSAMRSSLIA